MTADTLRQRLGQLPDGELLDIVRKHDTDQCQAGLDPGLGPTLGGVRLVMKAFGLGVLCLACLVAACMQSARSADVIDGYRDADCIAPLQAGRIRPPTREWQSTVARHDGSSVTVVGHQGPGGRISIKYAQPEAPIVAASVGDYVYPGDVRYSRAHDLLYVKLAGLSGGLLEETLLVEYDLGSRRTLRVVRVDPAALPPECAAGGLP